MITAVNGQFWMNMVHQPFRWLPLTCRPGDSVPDTIWLVRGTDGEFTVDKFVTILDGIGDAEIVHDATLVIGDNITALKWASVDAVTPAHIRADAHIRAAYH
jgi:hypothetical protein